MSKQIFNRIQLIKLQAKHENNASPKNIRDRAKRENKKSTKRTRYFARMTRPYSDTDCMANMITVCSLMKLSKQCPFHFRARPMRVSLHLSVQLRNYSLIKKLFAIITASTSTHMRVARIRASRQLKLHISAVNRNFPRPNFRVRQAL